MLQSAETAKVIEQEIIANGYNLHKRFPPGFIPTLIEKTGDNRNRISYLIAKMRKQKNYTCANIKNDFLPGSNSYIVKQYLSSNNYDLTKRLPSGSIDEIVRSTGLTKSQVKNAIHIIKRKNGLRIIKTSSIKKSPTNNLVKLFKKFGIERQSPNQNRIASDTILKHLMTIPFGGIGLLIGTATPFAVSNTSNNDLLLTDELDIAITLRTTCHFTPPVIVIGNLISPEKAKLKGEFWRNNNSTCNSKIIVGPVDRDYYTMHITRLVEKHSLVKVVLMTSGVWKFSKPSRKKYGHDFNFRSPSLALTKIYPNLHILALVMSANIFKVHHVNKGIETVL